jgi:hypothetical protein
MYQHPIRHGAAGALPFTGFESLRLTALALLLLIVGFILVRVALRSRSR